MKSELLASRAWIQANIDRGESDPEVALFKEGGEGAYNESRKLVPSAFRVTS